MRSFFVAILGLTLVGFAASANASSTHFDPGYYRKYTCQQLFDEGRKMSAQGSPFPVKLIRATLPMLRAEDIIVMPGIVSEERPISSQLALIKQQMLAIEDASIQSQCEIEFLGPPH